MYDIIIVGAGPAGLSAAIYASRARKKVLVLEALTYGGQIINASKIVNYPGFSEINGVDFATNLYEQAVGLGAEIKFDKVINIDTKEMKVITNSDSYSTRAIILAMGVQNKKTGLVNEDQFVGRGLSYCATCDGNFYKDKEVCVYGGEASTIEEALYLSDICSKVYVINKTEEFKDGESLLEEVNNKDNIQLLTSTTIKGINGDEKVESIDIFNKEGNSNIKISGLFIALGKIPENNNIVKDIKVDDNGYIVAREDCHTNINHIYVAGDIRTKNLRQLTTACADGANAATMAIKEMR